MADSSKLSTCHDRVDDGLLRCIDGVQLLGHKGILTFTAILLDRPSVEPTP